MAKAKAKSALKKLSPQHQKFVKLYMQEFNATRAYIGAGYSENGADGNACVLIGKDSIKAAVEEALEAQGITPGRIKCGIAGIAFGWSPSKRVTGANAHSEQDVLGALKELGRIQGMITERHEVTTAEVVVMFDDGTPAERVAAAAKVSEQQRKAAGAKK